MRQSPGLLPSSFKVHSRHIQMDGAMVILTGVVLLCAPSKMFFSMNDLISACIGDMVRVTISLVDI
jgi:hypothetical protein